MRNPQRGAELVRSVMQESRRRSATDSRPTTGMVGQRCVGYVTDSDGRLIRIAPPPPNDGYVGPGSYDPESPTSFSRRTKISGNSKRDVLRGHRGSPGPAAYDGHVKSSKLQHKLQSNAKPPAVEPFRSCNLEHQSWIKPSTPVPRRRFPQVRFKEDSVSPAFASRERRELWKPRDIPEPQSALESYTLPHEVYELGESPVFKSGEMEAGDDGATPSPCQYSLPDNLFIGPAFSMRPSFTVYREDMDDDKDTGPGPGYYNTEERKKPKPPNPVFANSIPRDPKRKERVPPPGSYEIHKVGDKKKPLTIGRKETRPSTSWQRASQEETPGPGSYQVAGKVKVKGGVMGVPAKRTGFAPENPDNPRSAYTSQHSSFIKRTYSSKYRHVNKFL